MTSESLIRTVLVGSIVGSLIYTPVSLYLRVRDRWNRWRGPVITGVERKKITLALSHSYCFTPNEIQCIIEGVTRLEYNSFRIDGNMPKTRVNQIINARRTIFHKLTGKNLTD